MTDCNTRCCTKCGIEQPLTAEFFSPAKGYKYGLNTQCRECRRKDARNYPSTKSVKKRLYKAEYSKRLDVVERRGVKRRERYANDPEFREYALKSCKDSKDKYPERYKIKKHDEYEHNKDRYKTSARKYYLNHRDVYIERARKQTEDPIKKAINVQRRLARKRQLPDTFTKDQWLACLKFFGNRCAVCGKLFDEKNKPYMDHWIPLKNPKCLGTVAENIVCLCGGKGGCNESKHAHEAKQWLLDFYPSEQARKILNRVHEYFLKAGDF